MAKSKREPNEPDKNKSFSVTYVDREHFTVGLHYHPEVELMLIKRGEGKRTVGNSTQIYGPGDLVLVGADVSHVWESSRRHHEGNSNYRAEAWVIKFKENCFGENFFEKIELQPIRKLLQRAQNGLLFTGKTQKLVTKRIEEMDWERGTRFIPALLNILHDLAEALDSSACTPLSDKERTTFKRTGNVKLLNKLRDYLMANYLNSNITLDQIVEGVKMDKKKDRKKLHNFFKNNTDPPQKMFGYINNLRIEDACRELVSTSEKISVISTKCGFNEVPTFNDRFKAITGKTPTQYRNDNQLKEEIINITVTNSK
jgi:AraC-like DNA-binding protein